MRLLVASTNEGKAKEIRRLLSDEMGMANGDWEILSLADLDRLWRTEKLGWLPPVYGNDELAEEEVRGRYIRLEEHMYETGSTFEENATIKATGAASFTGLLTIADDSGLEVDYLHGAPGVDSAHYAGAERDDTANNVLLLANMIDAPAGSRSARYKAVIALASPFGEVHLTTGVCEGNIGYMPKGNGGFGYDPLFVMPDGVTTMAELDLDEKNKVSHRGKALAQMLPVLSDLLDQHKD